MDPITTARRSIRITFTVHMDFGRIVTLEAGRTFCGIYFSLLACRNLANLFSLRLTDDRMRRVLYGAATIYLAGIMGPTVAQRHLASPASWNIFTVLCP